MGHNGCHGWRVLPRRSRCAPRAIQFLQREAREFGILDRLIDGDLLSSAIAFARTVLEKPALKTRERNQKLGTPQQNAPIFAAAREIAGKKQRGMIAPLAAIDAVEASTRLPFDEGCEVEKKLFNDCLFSDQSKALIHVFFGEREVAKIPDIPKETPVIPVNSVAVVGAGTMGGGIAMVFANAGIPVLLKDADQPALDRGIDVIRKNYASSVKRGRFTQQFVDERLQLIKPVLDYKDFGSVDMVIEAVFEGMQLKKEVFGAAGSRVSSPGAILASNTSTLSIDEIASATARPEAVIGTHFFSPANVMRLLEIVRGKASSKEVIATCMQLSKKLGKVGVLVGNCRGFVGNRMFGPYRREAQFPGRGRRKRQKRWTRRFTTSAWRWARWLQAIWPAWTSAGASAKNIGIWKNQASGSRLPKIVCAKWDVLVRKPAPAGTSTTRTGVPFRIPKLPACCASGLPKPASRSARFSPEEIVDRCILALVNEGARILEEGIALRAVDIDIIYLNGYGFPAYRGGPMWYADTVGLKNVHDRISEFHRQHGELWEPAALLKRLAQEGKTFAEFHQSQDLTAA